MRVHIEQPIIDGMGSGEDGRGDVPPIAPVGLAGRPAPPRTPWDFRHPPVLEEPGEDLTDYWTSRPHTDPEFITKVASQSRYRRRQAVYAYTVFEPADLPTKLSEIGDGHARLVLLIAQARRLVIGAEEQAAVLANLRSMIDTAESLVGHAIPDGRDHLTRAAKAVFEEPRGGGAAAVHG